MNRRRASVVMAIVIALLMATVAAGTDRESPALTPRAMAHCMMKRLRANNSESYRDAFKACKEQFAAAQANRSSETAITTAAASEQATKPRP